MNGYNRKQTRGRSIDEIKIIRRQKRGTQTTKIHLEQIANYIQITKENIY